MSPGIASRFLKYWNEERPVRVLSFFQTCWALAFLYEVLSSWWPDWALLFAEKAPLRTTENIYLPGGWNILSYFEADWIMQVALLVMILSTILVALNIGGRKSLIITLYLGSCFMDLSPAVIFAHNQFWKWTGVCLLIAPSPSFLSNKTQPVWNLRLIQLHLLTVYGITSAAKSFTWIWQQGTAVGFVFSSPGHLSKTGELLATTQFIQTPAVIHLATWGVLMVEALLPFCLFYRPTRVFGLFLAVCLHLSIFAVFDLDRFQFHMLAFLTCFIPDQWLKVLSSKHYAVNGIAHRFCAQIRLKMRR